MVDNANLILVVDDEIDVQRLFRQRFRKRIQAGELEFQFVLNGVEALEILKSSSSICMVLTDIKMPEMDGLTLLSKLSELEKTPRAIVVSAFGDLKNIRAAMNSGAFDFITKPIDFNDLELTIDKTLAALHEEREREQKLEEFQKELKNQELEQAALAKAKEVAEEANRTKSAFLSSMSHEIRTPMNGVLGMAELLSETDLDDVQKDYLQVIVSSGETLLAIINDILDFSKVESGLMEIIKDLLVLEDLVKSVLALLYKQALDRDINFQYSISSNVPQSILGDSGRIRQVLINLIGNAVKFTKSGNVDVSVDLRSQSELIFAIQDTGIGIDRDRLGLLFHRFSQGDASISRKYGGTGLGLAISKHLVELMGGQIWVESHGHIAGNPPVDWRFDVASHREQGACFYFTIEIEPEPKLTEIHATEMRGIEMRGIEMRGIEIHSAEMRGMNSGEVFSQKVSEIESLSLNQSSLRILVAEDDIFNQKIIQIFLKNLGHNFVDIAKNGLEALSMLNIQAYDLIFMDMQMPEMDGIEATKKIRQQGYSQPWIVALTANAMPEHQQLCIDAGMDDYISKPIHKEDLLRVFKTFSASAGF